MKRISWKIMAAADISFAALGLILSLLFWIGLVPTWAGLIGLIGLISGIVDGSAYLVWSHRLSKTAQDYKEYEEREDVYED